jgi:hypothetical protein
MWHRSLRGSQLALVRQGTFLIRKKPVLHARHHNRLAGTNICRDAPDFDFAHISPAPKRAIYRLNINITASVGYFV